MKLVILGAGIAGLSAAYAVRQRGGDALIFEKETSPGGLCRSAFHDGFSFDAISHVLHFSSPRILHIVRTLLDGNLAQERRSAAIYYRGQHIPYPFQSHLGFLPWKDCTSALVQFVWAKLGWFNRTEAKNFQQWLDRECGSGIDRQFMGPYNRKLWGMELDKLSMDWMRFVPRNTIRAVLRSALHGRSQAGYNAVFWYPRQGGIQSLAEALAREATVAYGHEVKHIDLLKQELTFQTGRRETYDALVSTLPLPVLARLSAGLPGEAREAALQLRSTTLHSIVYCIRRPLPHTQHWIYYAAPEFPFFRLFFGSNVSPRSAPQGCATISAEISNACADDVVRLEAATRECLKNLGYVRRDEDIAHMEHFYLPFAYPVHDLRRSALVRAVQNALRRHGVISIGRFGSWEYGSIEDAIAQGLDAAQDVAAFAPFVASARA